MKKLLFFVASIVLVGCSDDDSQDNRSNEELIVGKWATLGSVRNDGPFVEYENDCPTQKNYNEFLSDGTITYYGYNSECENVEVEPGTYEVDGDILYLYDSFDPPLDKEFTIVSLDEEELVLYRSFTDGPDGQITETVTLERID